MIKSIIYNQRFNKFEDDRGTLYPINFTELPFNPKRLFYVKDVPINTIRGDHAHYLTKQLLICLNGKIMVNLFDGRDEIEYTIKSGEYIFVDKMIWDYQKFLTNDDILLVICSTEFEKDDYIKDKDKFIKMTEI